MGGDGRGRFFDVVEAGSGELLTFGLTPPRASTSPERVAEIARTTLARIEPLPIDALALYDISDEEERADTERPFPFSRTLDPADYIDGPLAGWDKPAVVYRCVGKYDESELTGWMQGARPGLATVFVGPATSDQAVRTRLGDAYGLHRDRAPRLPLGAVAIPERHASAGGEDARMIRKQEAGCRFFVSQVVYNLTAARDLASDYAYACRDRGVAPAPLVFTLSLCGSDKTLEFLQWLGVDVPRWVQNELVHSQDTLAASQAYALSTARLLADFCRYLGLPFGFNVESVSNRKAEIDAAVSLTHAVAEILERP